MTTEGNLGASRVDRLIELFEQAVDLPALELPDFVAKVATSDAALAAELQGLLDAHLLASGYFENLAGELVPAYAAATSASRDASIAALLVQMQEALGPSYRILRELGGGMSRVFLADEVKLGRKVVIKVLPPETTEGASVERFRREIQLAAQLQHPHIVPLLTSDSVQSLLYYTMPFVAGESLAARLAREGALSLRDAREIWRDVLDALTHAHASGVIHRDIKPGNILLTARSAVVADFGIARAIQVAGKESGDTTQGIAAGTPAYMAPEQVTGNRDADHRVDLYAAGLVMYEMLEGRRPFSGESVRKLALARLTQDPAPMTRPDCPLALAALVMRCLARDAAGRPPTAEALLAELDGIPITGTTGSSLTAEMRDVVGFEPSVGVSADRGAVGNTRRWPPRRVLASVLAAMVVAVLSLGARQLLTGDRNGTPIPNVADIVPASIAVLPLANLSANPADAALADGMREELVTALGALGDLRVIPTTSVRALVDLQLPVRQLAESLRVSYVLEGGFQKAGQQLRLQARLVDARDGSTRWSHTYTGEMRDLLALEDSFARAVAGEVGVRLVDKVSRRRRYQPRIEAHEWYMRGMDLSLLRLGNAGQDSAVASLQRAIAADSGFAAAYAGLAGTIQRGVADEPGKEIVNLRLAERMAQKAIALDDSLADGHAALGWVRISLRQWRSAVEELQTAIALDPRSFRVFEGLARVYVYTGPRLEQLAAARTGLEMDPFSTSAIREMAIALAMNGRCDEALERLRPLKALVPRSGVVGILRGQCFAAQQNWEQAIAEFRWAMSNSSARASLAFLGYALARSGQRDSALHILSDLETGRQNSHGAFGIATVHMGLGNLDAAFAWLDKAIDQHTVRVYVMGPMFADLHRDARFAHVRRRMGL